MEKLQMGFKNYKAEANTALPSLILCTASKCLYIKYFRKRK